MRYLNKKKKKKLIVQKIKIKIKIIYKNISLSYYFILIQYRYVSLKSGCTRLREHKLLYRLRGVRVSESWMRLRGQLLSKT